MSGLEGEEQKSRRCWIKGMWIGSSSNSSDEGCRIGTITYVMRGNVRASISSSRLPTQARRSIHVWSLV